MPAGERVKQLGLSALSATEAGQIWSATPRNVRYALDGPRLRLTPVDLKSFNQAVAGVDLIGLVTQAVAIGKSTWFKALNGERRYSGFMYGKNEKDLGLDALGS